jgi:iron complex transport system ATP-binding protein
MAIVPQETHLAFDYTALEVVMMGRYPHLATFEIEGPADFSIARDAMRATGRWRSRIGSSTRSAAVKNSESLSPRRSLRSRTPAEDGILLLDEPTVALDLAYQLELGDLCGTDNGVCR